MLTSHFVRGGFSITTKHTAMIPLLRDHMLWVSDMSWRIAREFFMGSFLAQVRYRMYCAPSAALTVTLLCEAGREGFWRDCAWYSYIGRASHIIDHFLPFPYFCYPLLHDWILLHCLKRAQASITMACVFARHGLVLHYGELYHFLFFGRFHCSFLSVFPIAISCSPRLEWLTLRSVKDASCGQSVFTFVHCVHCPYALAMEALVLGECGDVGMLFDDI